MKFVLDLFTSNIKLELEDEEVVKKDVAAHSKYLSAKFGKPIECLRYEGSPEHMRMVAAVAEEATTGGVWSFDEGTDSKDETDVEEIVEGIFQCKRWVPL
jgi:hypothetical protein